MTDRHNSTESGSPESHFNHNYEKIRSLLEINCSQGETALCCAVLALSCTDTLVSLISRPVPGHQRLDDCRSPLGASQHQKKTLFQSTTKFVRKNCTHRVSLPRRIGGVSLPSAQRQAKSSSLPLASLSAPLRSNFAVL